MYFLDIEFYSLNEIDFLEETNNGHSIVKFQ